MKPLRGTALKRFLRAQARPDADLVLVLADVEDPVNVGSAFRIADALGIRRVVLTGISAKPPHKLITKVGRAKDQKVPWSHVPDVQDALRSLGAEGYLRCAIELTEDAVPYDEFEFPAKTALVAGHEDHGVTQKALEHVDAKVFIPMYGKGASLNVHVAIGIVSFEVLALRRRLSRSA